MLAYQKPLPLADELSQPFWDAARRHELWLQYCPGCTQFIHPPKPRCPHCMETVLEWQQVSGLGEIYTYAIVHHRGVRGFEDEVPYVIALIQLEEQGLLRLLSNVVNCQPSSIRVGLPVQAFFDDVTPDTTLVKFAPRDVSQGQGGND